MHGLSIPAPCAYGKLQVIGRKGVTIRHLQEQSGCSFSLDRNAKPLPLFTVIAATQAATEIGEQLVLQVIQHGTPPELQERIDQLAAEEEADRKARMDRLGELLLQQ